MLVLNCSVLVNVCFQHEQRWTKNHKLFTNTLKEGKKNVVKIQKKNKPNHFFHRFCSGSVKKVRRNVPKIR